MQKRKKGRFDLKYTEKLHKKQVAIRFSSSVRANLTAIAQERGISVTELIREIVEEYLQNRLG